MDNLGLLRSGVKQLWLNGGKSPAAEALRGLTLTYSDIEDADARLRRFAPLIERLFPETKDAGGMIESPLTETPKLKKELGCSGRVFVKRDSELPIAGSVKARGGIYEVLLHTEELLGEAVFSMSPDEIREKLKGYTVQVGSTGNLGLSIGIMSAALGYRAIVHMSSDAKEWKKALLREKGVEVIEYAGDYSSAVAEGRRRSEADPMSYFVDDESSVPLFLGYAVAALRLKKQLEEQDVTVDAEHPLNVYLPCGVGGAPGGITFGLKHVFGDSVNCWFVEPTEAPCMLAAFFAGGPVPVTELGLSGKTEADGLAVGTASKLVYDTVKGLVSGEFTVYDAALRRNQNLLYQNEGVFIEPSSASSLDFPAHFGWGIPDGENVTHIAWATGGRLVPEEERKKQLYTRVAAALIWRGGRFMICQRPPHKARGGLWEFVGGKLEEGETGEAALIRECREEIGITVEPKGVFMRLIHRYPDITVELTVYNARIGDKEPKLLEHTAIEWITPAEADGYEFCPADKEILAMIKKDEEISARLLKLGDEQYGSFTGKLVPSVDRKTIIGIRFPELRELTKKLKGTDEAREFLACLPHSFYEENILHALLINEEKSFDNVTELLDGFLPYVDNWAVCDTLKPKAFGRHSEELWKKIPDYLSSEHEYTRRFGLGMLMKFFLDGAFKKEALDLAYAVADDRYYVKMMKAWFFATAAAKRWKETLPYIEKGLGDRETKRMTIRKCLDSFRISEERKAYLKEL